MKTRAVLARWYPFSVDQKKGSYVPVSVHPTVPAAAAQVRFLGGKLSSITRYPDKDTFTITTVESFE